jgi:hypothetical protein
MANTLGYQVIKDTTEHTVIKLTGFFDGSGQENDHRRIQANTLYGALDSSKANLLSSAANTGPLPYYGLAVNRLWYDCADGTGQVSLFWHADSVKYIFHLNGNSEFDGMGNWTTIPNETKGSAGSVGDIGLITRGMVANSTYTLVIELRKDNEHYQRGQFNDPAAFNYPPYGVRP